MERLVEKWSPLAMFFVAFFVLIYFADPIATSFATGDLKSEGLYSAIFGWSAIQTGFSFGVYGFVAGRNTKFIQAIENTVAIRIFIKYIKKANYSGFMLTFSSIPLIVINPELNQPNTKSYIFVALWFSLFVWSFLAFLRIAYNFGKIVGIRDKPFLGA